MKLASIDFGDGAGIAVRAEDGALVSRLNGVFPQWLPGSSRVWCVFCPSSPNRRPYGAPH
jgi:hypothetical protein